MNSRELALWTKINRRASRLEPEVAQKILKAFRAMADALDESTLTKAIQSGDIERIFNELIDQATMDKAFQPARDVLRDGIANSAKLFAAEIPQLSGVFNILSPHIIDAIRALEAPLFSRLESDTRETVRAYIENGLRDGVGPKTIAKNLRSYIGLGPTQLQEVENYKDALLGLNGRNVADYTLRDKRFSDSATLTPEQVDARVAAYTKRRIAQNAETNARTAALQAQKLGQKLAIDDAIRQGIYDPNRLQKQWIGVNDDRERPEHVAMNDQVVPYDSAYTNGQMIPGEGEYNCRCISRFFQAQGA